MSLKEKKILLLLLLAYYNLGDVSSCKFRSRRIGVVRQATSKFEAFLFVFVQQKVMYRSPGFVA
jgi:hypothetical protein